MHRRTAPLLAAAVLVLAAGCASGSDLATGGGTSTPAGSATPDGGSDGSSAGSSNGIASGEPNPAAEPVTVTVSVHDGTVTPEPHRVKVPLGRTVELQVTSDVDDELHVHGFDVEEPLEAGRTTTVTLHADEAGLYEVETHDSGLQLLQLEVR